MSSDWTNKEAILHDLAIAQGNVPVGIVETVSSNEKPPAIPIVEETEEQFLLQYASDGKTNVRPDVDLMQEMLDRVRYVRVNEIEASDSEDKEPIPEKSIKPTNSSKSSPNKYGKKCIDKSKRNRNAAFESLLDLNGNQGDVDVKENKQDNIMPLAISPEIMFKSKKSKCVNNSSPSNIENGTKVIKPGTYVPSTQAQEYYEKIMENKRQKEIQKENIWTRAERQMREIEARRKNSNFT